MIKRKTWGQNIGGIIWPDVTRSRIGFEDFVNTSAVYTMDWFVHQ